MPVAYLAGVPLECSNSYILTAHSMNRLLAMEHVFCFRILPDILMAIEVSLLFQGKLEAFS